uniref:Transposable element n=1 Tax=Heterorhabditis bacteriophora TaxID=37862 RepID=A0A1I7WHQ7_HETBA
MLDKCPNIVRSRSDKKKLNLDGPVVCHSYSRDLHKGPRHFSTRNFGGRSAMLWDGSFKFQQDNATIHASQSTKTWLENNNVDTMN